MTPIIKDSDLVYDGYQVFYFYGNGMPFQNRIFNILKNLEVKYKNISFFCADVFTTSFLVKRFNLIEVPTIIVTSNGIERGRLSGLTMSTAIRSFIFKIANDFNIN